MSIDGDRYAILTGDLKTDDQSDTRGIGDRIRAIREEKGFSHEQMANLTGFDVDLLSRIEKGDLKPPIGVLVKLSRALDSAFSRLLSGVGNRFYSITRKDERKLVSRSTSPKGKKLYTYQSLAPEVQGRHMESLIVTLEENPFQEMSVHDGEEFIFVLEKDVLVRIGEDLFELGPGDSVYYLSTMPHMIAARKDHAVILAVIYSGEASGGGGS